MQSKLYPHMLGNDDGHDKATGEILEIKTASAHAFRRAWAKGVPLYIQVQVQQYMEVADAPAAVVACFVDYATIHLYYVARDHAFGGKLGTTIESWWAEHVEGGTPPSTDGSESCDKALKTLYPEPYREEPVALTDESLFGHAHMLEEGTAMAKKAKGMVSKAKNALRAALAGDAVGILPDGRRVCAQKTGRGTTIKVKPPIDSAKKGS